MPSPPSTTAAKASQHALLALLWALFVAYGSLVPLDFRPRPDAWQAFMNTPWLSLGVGSRADWVANKPGSDTALMLALVHTLVVNGLHDRAFLDRYTAGWPIFERYLLGETDGQPKDANWAAPIAGLPAEEIVALAKRLHGKRALIVGARIEGGERREIGQDRDGRKRERGA